MDKQYLLSQAAATDIGDIYDYTFEKFGQQQTITYLKELESQII